MATLVKIFCGNPRVHVYYYLIKLAFPQKMSRKYFGGNPTSHFSYGQGFHENVWKNLQATPDYQLGFPQIWQEKILMATLDYQLEIDFHKELKNIQLGTLEFSKQKIQKHISDNPITFQLGLPHKISVTFLMRHFNFRQGFHKFFCLTQCCHLCNKNPATLNM